jgi:hypothetical protein
VSSAQLSSETQSSWCSPASNAHDHATAKDALLDQFNTGRVLTRLQTPLEMCQTRTPDDDEQQVEKMLTGPAAMQKPLVGDPLSAFHPEQAER